MSEELRCPRCQKLCRVEDRLAGKSVLWPNPFCRTQVAVPEPASWPLWVYWIFGVNLFLVVSPFVVAAVGNIFDVDFDAAMCLVAAVTLALGVTLLVLRVGRSEVPNRRRSIAVPLIASATFSALLFFGLGIATTDVVAGSGSSPRGDTLARIVFTGTGVVWILWILFFGLLARSVEPDTLVDRLFQCVVAGSVLELLVAIPMHLIVRRRSECSAGVGTGIGICLGILVMLVTIGPGVSFLFFRRYKQVYAGRRKRNQEHGYTSRG